jgi:hypothetical protein
MRKGYFILGLFFGIPSAIAIGALLYMYLSLHIQYGW